MASFVVGAVSDLAGLKSHPTASVIWSGAPSFSPALQSLAMSCLTHPCTGKLPMAYPVSHGRRPRNVYRALPYKAS